MADLEYIYGTMASGKTTKLLIDNYNYRKNGANVAIIKPLIDTKGGSTVVSRMEESANVDVLLGENDSLLDINIFKKIASADVILADEAQFFTEEQIWELWYIAHRLNVSVICYGLKSDFLGNLFPGSSALLAISDFKTELSVRCKCGKPAIFNARMIDGKYITSGETVAIDGEQSVSYVPLCSDCFMLEVLKKDQPARVLKK